jgi:broad specificity phosphatase PhoE
MTADQIAKAIKEEFSVICIATDEYYIWNPPYDVEGEKLRDLRIRIEQRIEELEQRGQ